MSNKSWALTGIVFAFALGAVVLDVLTGITITETQFNHLLYMVGITSGAGVSNSVFKNRASLKQLIQDTIKEMQK